MRLSVLYLSKYSYCCFVYPIAIFSQKIIFLKHAAQSNTIIWDTDKNIENVLKL